MTLPNGAMELERKRVNTDREIVLAVWEKSHGKEFVTWVIYHNDDRSTGNGHYFISLEGAVRDFNARN